MLLDTISEMSNEYRTEKSNSIDINNRIDDLFKIHIIYGVFPINDSNIDHKLSEREQNSHKRRRSKGMHIVNTPKMNTHTQKQHTQNLK